MSVDDKIIHFYLEARCGSVRVSTAQSVSVDSFNVFRDRGFFGLYEGTVRAMELELGPYVEQLAGGVQEPERQ